MEPSELAHLWHTLYERHAEQFGVFKTGQAYETIPGNTKMLMEAVAMEVMERMRTVIRATECTNIGQPENGDVIVMRYLEGMVSAEERKKDYSAVRHYFQMNGIHVRIIGVSGDQSLDKVSEEEMATFGWYKR